MWRILDQLSDSQLFKKGSAVWSYLDYLSIEFSGFDEICCTYFVLCIVSMVEREGGEESLLEDEEEEEENCCLGNL
jgi:hypothetical protein